MGIWWKRTTSAGAVLGMIAGFGICLFYLIGTQYFEMPLWFGVKNISCGLFGIPAAFIVTYVVSLVTPAPAKEMQDFIDSIRIPRGTVATLKHQAAVE
jgi:cation/acetate symporter